MSSRDELEWDAHQDQVADAEETARWELWEAIGSPSCPACGVPVQGDDDGTEVESNLRHECEVS